MIKWSIKATPASDSSRVNVFTYHSGRHDVFCSVLFF